MARESNIELDRSRSAFGLIGVTFKLYGRYPWLFFVLAAGVVVPYLLIVVAITGDGPFAYRHLTFLGNNAITVADLALVVPLVSALHVHAVLDVSKGKEPRLSDVARRGVRHLPLVTLVVVISWLGIMLGTLLLVVPGILLAIYWSVVAQTAALEGGRWSDPFNRSDRLAEGTKLHILGLIFLAALIPAIPDVALVRAFHDSDSTALAFVAGVAMRILSASFSALSTAVLFFELKVREQERAAFSSRARSTSEADPPVGSSGRVVEPTGHPFDPTSYTDEDRPPGWYVIPDTPWKMRYWAADGKGEWGRQKAKTPKDVRETWRDTRWIRESAPGEEPA
jgi:hypothetical protein